MKWFNNLKLAPKLLVSFLFVALIAEVIGYFGLKDIHQIAKSDNEMYEQMTIPISQLMNISTNFQRLRSNSFLAVIENDPKLINDQLDRIDERKK